MYYPKSQIKTNLKSNGNEFTIAGRSYVGDYFETSDGRYFTGKSPANPPNKPLTPRRSEDNTDFNKTNNIVAPGKTSTFNYNQSYFEIDYSYWAAKKLNYNNPPDATLPPVGSLPKPTEQDYKTGEFNRYFVKKNNEFQYIEVDKDMYEIFLNKDNRYQYELYTPIKINWILTGKPEKVFNTNKNIVALAERNNNIRGFRGYFMNNYLKYYVAKEIEENLSTDGTEFKNQRTGRPYVGKYHIHPEKGPMVGAKHIKEKHDYLVPINEVIGNDGTYSINRQTNTRSGGGY